MFSLQPNLISAAVLTRPWYPPAGMARRMEDGAGRSKWLGERGMKGWFGQNSAQLELMSLEMGHWPGLVYLDGVPHHPVQRWYLDHHGGSTFRPSKSLKQTIQ